MSGQIVALTRCPAWIGNDEAEPISGLWTLEELILPDRTCGQYDRGWIVVNDEGMERFVSDDDLIQQINPHSYGRQLVQEREMEFAAEDGLI